MLTMFVFICLALFLRFKLSRVCFVFVWKDQSALHLLINATDRRVNGISFQRLICSGQSLYNPLC